MKQFIEIDDGQFVNPAHVPWFQVRNANGTTVLNITVMGFVGGAGKQIELTGDKAIKALEKLKRHVQS